MIWGANKPPYANTFYFHMEKKAGFFLKTGTFLFPHPPVWFIAPTQMSAFSCFTWFLFLAMQQTEISLLSNCTAWHSCVKIFTTGGNLFDYRHFYHLHCFFKTAMKYSTWWENNEYGLFCIHQKRMHLIFYPCLYVLLLRNQAVNTVCFSKDYAIK